MKIESFVKQQIFPGFYASLVNKKVEKSYNNLDEFEFDITEITDFKRHIIKLEKELEAQLTRKEKIENKAKSLLFIISVSITAIAFSLSFLSTNPNLISIVILTLSIAYFIFGAIRTIQTINIRRFHLTPA